MCANSTATTTTDELGRRDEESLLTRILDNPRPAATWTAVALALVVLEFGALAGGVLAIVDAIVIGVTAFFDVLVGVFSPALATDIVEFQQSLSGFISGFRHTAGQIPTLLSRDVIPNEGHKVGPNGPWVGTFLGLPSHVAWALRVLVVLVYSAVSFYWAYRGWIVYRDHYRYAKWTPRDDVVNRLRGHRWGQFGIVILVLFLTMALFAPTLGPTTVEKNIMSPYSYETQFYSAESGQVETVTNGFANFNSKSKGQGDQNVGPMTYDDFGRFHPFGTLTNGRDLFTFMMGGARIALIVVTISIGLSALVAATMSLLAAYYGGLTDLTTLTIADGIVSVPQLLLLILVSVVFQDHWLANVLDGGFLIALIFAFTGWPFLWRALRGPALQVAEQEWVDAAKSFGQRPTVTMRKHMLPYVLGYLLVYASMTVGSVIIGLAALSFLGNGLGITPPTPAWGRAVSLGQNYVSTSSWHISLIPGLMIVILVTGMNALGDGIRDAIDPESKGGGQEEAAAGGGG